MLDFNFLGVRTVSNTTDLRYKMRKWFGVYAGYTFSDRQSAWKRPSISRVCRTARAAVCTRRTAR